jgi:phosphoglycerate dehydrogenase-like enzyme
MLVVANLAIEHPAWSLPPELLSGLIDEFPSVEFHWNRQRRDYFRRATEAEVIWGWYLEPDILALAQNLKWFHSCAAGVRRSCYDEVARSGITLTNSAVVNAPVVVEHLLGMLLSFFRRLAGLGDHQRKHHWGRDEYCDLWCELKEFSAMTVGIFGYGAIGSRLAAILHLLGSRVMIYRRRQLPAASADEVFTGEGISKMLPLCNLVVNALAATDGTDGFFNADVFGRMKPGAVFASFGHGCTTDEAALMRALGYSEKNGCWEKDGWLGGAVLDVFAEEPLPPGSPLWKAPNVLISPHVAAVSPHFWERQLAFFARNLRHFLAGEPLEEVVDCEAGY